MASRVNGSRWWAVATVAAAMFGAVPEGPAYLVNVTTSGTDVAWVTSAAAPNVSAGRITYYIDGTSVSDVSPQQFADAVRSAIAGWEAFPGSNIAFLEDNSRPTTLKNHKDKINRIGFTAGELGPFTYAVAFRAFQQEKILDTDIVFNPEVRVNDGSNGGAGTPAPWSVATPGMANTADVAAVCAHEWGHCLGFDHIPLGRSTMYFALPAGAIMIRSPETDDFAGLGSAYPSAALATDYGVLSGRADVTGTTNDRGVHVVAIDYGTGRPAASAFSRPDGSWNIEGLPPGAYRVIASPIGSEKVRIHVYNPFWDSSVTSFVPVSWNGESGDVTAPVLLAAGATVEDIDLSVTSVSGDPGEPDNSQGTARPLVLGTTLGGRISSTSDDDYFSFEGTAGQKVNLYVHAAQIGSDLDPRITLFSPLGVQLRDNRDIRTGSLAFDEEGFDLDARILDYVLPQSGTYTVRVTSDVVMPDAPVVQDYFYVLAVLPSDDAPNPFTSTFTVTPGIVDADGVSMAEVVFHPRGLTGGSSGPALDVTFERVADGDPDGSLGAVVDNLDGTYSAPLTAASGAGSDILRAKVDGATVSEVTATYRGPAAAGQSDFSVTPRRIRPDGSSTSTVTLVPRDVHGTPHGPGREVAFMLESDPDAAVGAAGDEGDGSYSATVTAGDERESLALRAIVDGQDIGTALFVGVGFPLDDVVEESLGDLDDLLASPSTPIKALKKLGTARSRLDSVKSLPVPEQTEPVLNAMRVALKQIEGAIAKGAAAQEIVRTGAEAARQASGDALETASTAISDPKEQKAFDKATLLHDAGDALLDQGLYSKAAAKFRAAVKQTLRIDL